MVDTNNTETEIEHFFRVYIASSKHEEGWENSRQLCKTRDVVEELYNFREFSQPSPPSPNLLKNTRESKTSQPCLHTLI